MAIPTWGRNTLVGLGLAGGALLASFCTYYQPAPNDNSSERPVSLKVTVLDRLNGGKIQGVPVYLSYTDNGISRDTPEATNIEGIVYFENLTNDLKASVEILDPNNRDAQIKVREVRLGTEPEVTLTLECSEIERLKISHQPCLESNIQPGSPQTLDDSKTNQTAISYRLVESNEFSELAVDEGLEDALACYTIAGGSTPLPFDISYEGTVKAASEHQDELFDFDGEARLQCTGGNEVAYGDFRVGSCEGDIILLEAEDTQTPSPIFKLRWTWDSEEERDCRGDIIGRRNLTAKVKRDS